MAFELTALPAPDVLETLDYDTILTALVSRFRTINPNYSSTVEGDPAYTLLEAMAYVEVMLRKRINDAARSVLVTHAVGADLDNLGASFNVYRRILQAANPDADPPIPEILETDTSLRTRILTALETIAIGSEAWYKKHALDVNDTLAGDATKVKDAAIYKGNTGGTIKLYVQADNANPVPDSTLLTKVRAYVTAKERRFLCDTVDVAAVAVLSYELQATLVVAPGFTPATVVADILKRANAFVKERQIIGKEIPLSHIYAALITEAVAELTLTKPASNVIPKKGGIVSNADEVPEVPVASSVQIGLTP